MEEKYVQSPPRDLSFAGKFYLLFGRTISQIGFGVTSFGMIFFFVFVLNSEFFDFYKFSGNLNKTEGVITDISVTSASEGSKNHQKNIYELSFEFEDNNGNKQANSSYALSFNYKKGDKIPVVYNVDKPIYSKIEGLRSGMFSSFVIFVTIFPLIGIVMILINFITGLKYIKMFTIGQTVIGKLSDVIPTNTYVNKERIYKHVFLFTVNEKEFKAFLREPYNRDLMKGMDIANVISDIRNMNKDNLEQIKNNIVNNMKESSNREELIFYNHLNPDENLVFGKTKITLTEKGGLKNNSNLFLILILPAVFIIEITLFLI